MMLCFSACNSFKPRSLRGRLHFFLERARVTYLPGSHMVIGCHLVQLALVPRLISWVLHICPPKYLFVTIFIDSSIRR
jgi:hypothetical protein